MTFSSDIDRNVRASFAAQAFMSTAGAEIIYLSEGRCDIAAPVGQAFAQQHGYAHAGLTFALGDSAAGYAALSVMQKDAEVLTTEMKINLLAPAKGDRLIAKGRVLKPGRRLVVVQADVFAVDGTTETHVAALQGTMIPV